VSRAPGGYRDRENEVPSVGDLLAGLALFAAAAALLLIQWALAGPGGPTP
jgi:hypothetical protein